MTTPQETPKEVKPYHNLDEKPILFSLLYDLDLLPEQLKENSKQWYQMICICEHWQRRSEPSKPTSEPVSGEDAIKSNL